MEKTRTAMQKRKIKRNLAVAVTAGKAKTNRKNFLKNFLLKTDNTLDVVGKKPIMTEMEPG